MESSGPIIPAAVEANGALARNIDRAAAGSHRAIQQVTDSAHPAVDRMASGAHQAVNRMADAATQAAESIGTKGDRLRESQTRLMENCSGYVRSNPLTALGIAVAAGFLISRLTSSR